MRLLPKAWLITARFLQLSLLFGAVSGVGVALAAPASRKTLRRQTPQQAFIQSMTPAIQAANQSVIKERTRLQKDYIQWKAGKVISKKEWGWLKFLATKYKINDDINLFKNNDWEKLIGRVDIVPTPLVLAQAINESAWGKSRFAKQGNNFFGRWCYTPGCGIVPKQRPAGASYEVKKYPSKQASIEDYLRNINTNAAYKSLRELRKAERSKSNVLDSNVLATGLIHYSERGGAYVNAVKGIIKHHQLNEYS